MSRGIAERHQLPSPRLALQPVSTRWQKHMELNLPSRIQELATLAQCALPGWLTAIDFGEYQQTPTLLGPSGASDCGTSFRCPIHANDQVAAMLQVV
eukprot:2852100-Rhodomonas_salina.2